MQRALLKMCLAAAAVAALMLPARGAEVANPAAVAQPIDRARLIQPHPSFTHCCREKVWDANGKEIGDLLGYDERYAPQTLVGFVAYHLKGGDAVTLQVTPDVIQGLQSPGGMTALFTTPDCSGNTMFATVYWPPLAKRYAMVLLGGNPSSLLVTATSAWLWVTPPLPARAMPLGSSFHSQWTESGACAAVPPPGFPVQPPGGFWMQRVEDLFAKYHRPFYIDY